MSVAIDTYSDLSNMQVFVTIQLFKTENGLKIIHMGLTIHATAHCQYTNVRFFQKYIVYLTFQPGAQSLKVEHMTFCLSDVIISWCMAALSEPC